MIKTLDKYVFTQLIWPFLFGFCLFVTIIAIDPLMSALQSLVNEKTDFITIFRWFLNRLPQDMIFTFPMSVLLSNLLVFGRMSKDSETTAMKAGGINFYRILAPVTAFGLTITIISIIFNETVVPGSNERARKIRRQEILKLIEADSTENSIMRTSDGAFAYARKVYEKKGHMDKVLLEYYDEEQNLQKRISASTADWNGSMWIFKNAVLQEYVYPASAAAGPGSAGAQGAVAAGSGSAGAQGTLIASSGSAGAQGALAAGSGSAGAQGTLIASSGSAGAQGAVAAGSGSAGAQGAVAAGSGSAGAQGAFIASSGSAGAQALLPADIYSDRPVLTKPVSIPELPMPEIKDTPAEFARESKRPTELSYKDLKTRIESYERAQFMDTTELRVGLAMKTSLPFASFFFAIIGAAFGLSNNRSGAFIGFGVSMIIIFTYYVVMSVFTSLGKSGVLPPLLSAWMQNIIFAFVGLYIVKNING